MFHYFIPHCTYHLIRWFPKNNRIKIRIILMLCIVMIVAPEIYVLANPRSTRFCSQPLFKYLITSISFTFCMIGFSFLFSLMDPVPYEVKIVFHVFGGCSFIYSIAQAASVFNATDCETYSAELYWYSFVEGILGVLFLVFFGLTIPFWLLNKWKKNYVLDQEYRTGICYEPVNCCSCIWHV